MAASRSCDMPMERCSSPCSAANSRRRRKYGRDASVVGPWRHGHQAQQPQVRRGAHGGDERGQFLGRRRRLGLLRRKLDFKQHVKRLAGFVKAAGEFSRIHGLDATKQLRGAGALVALQVPDQMESRAGQIAHRGIFAFEFLHIVFAELAQAQFVGVANGLRGEHLGDGQQQDCAGLRCARSAARAMRRRTAASLSASVSMWRRYSRPACASISRNCRLVRMSMAWAASLPSRSYTKVLGMPSTRKSSFTLRPGSSRIG